MKTRRLLLMTMLALLASFHATLMAQTVNISPKTGNVISAVSYKGEAHEANFGGAWIHNQIPLMLLTSDKADLSEYGLMKEHANNVSANGSGLRVVSGANDVKNHMTLSLPKGYRFTSYRIVMSNSAQSDVNTTFKEMNADFTTAITSVSLGNHNNTTNEYSLSRTASSSADMGNILYFLQDKDRGTSYVDIKAFEITFECADPFTETLTPSATIASGVDCLLIPFSTCRTDLGQVELSTNNHYTSLKYNYNNVKDLPAYFTLYDMDGIENGSASPSALKDGHITTIGNYYGLKKDTYYIEVPTDATAQGGINIPLGYRITGAKIHYANYAPSSAIKLGDSFYITDGEGNYMNANLQFTSTPVVWNSDDDGKVWTENTYLRENNRNLTTTTNSNNASSFKVEGTNLYYHYQGWIKFFISSSGSFTVRGTRAVLVNTGKAEASSYTVKLYDKDGTTVAQSADVNDNNANGTLEVTGLNNDAIKFEVSGDDNATAYLYAELTLEALNPYISKVDVVAKQLDNEQTISQQYLADDFAIGNGLIDFKVPVNFAQKTIQFSFDNLTCKKADNTYGPQLSSTGNSRYNFVNSYYYNFIGENLQAHRTDAANYDYTKKVAVAVTGTQAFKVNNSDKFKAGTSQSDERFYYKEFRYSNSEYTNQGGSFKAIQLANGNEKNVYLMVVDETRYNIAPTTTPRHAFYAYYTTNIKLSTEEYEPALTYVKVYDNAMLASGFDANAYYGVKVGAKNKGENTEVEAGKGYLFANQIVDQIRADVANKVAPVDAKHILYVDASGLNAVLYGTDTQWGKIEDIKDLIGTNAMIYLPQGATYSLDNLASKTVSGDFKAENNIILADKQPFYAPYDIRIDANNYAQYTREITNNNGVVQYASLVLPFTVAIDEKGTHTNDDGQSKFTFYKMQLTNALSDPKQTDNYNYEVTGHFEPLSGMLATESNKPYLVIIDNETKEEGADILFVARQHGASIIKTPASLDGETAKGTLGTEQVSFVQHGTLNGVQLEKNNGYFYFAKNRFVSSLNLKTSDYVYVMPFRTYYDYAGAAQARYMNISLEPNSDITGISDITTGNEDRPFGFASGSGSLTITAFADITVNVRAVNGQTVERCTLKAGETRTVNVPAGIYIVNDMKVAVK